MNLRTVWDSSYEELLDLMDLGQKTRIQTRTAI